MPHSRRKLTVRCNGRRGLHGNWEMEMSKPTPFAWGMLLVLLSSGIAVATAAEGGHRCASVAEPAKRLACYDEAFPPPPAVHEAAVQKARDDFGRNEPKPPLANPGQDAGELTPSAIESRITALAFDNGQRRVTLENGQVWRQTEATTGGNMAVGDVVRLRKGVLGNFFLVTPSGVGLRVRRIR